MDDQLKKIREEASLMYNKSKMLEKERIDKVKSTNVIPCVKYLFHKTDDQYFVNINGNILKIEDCRLKLYGDIRSLSEFGKTFDSAYVKTINGEYYKINEKTFIVSFLDIKYYMN